MVAEAPGAVWPDPGAAQTTEGTTLNDSEFRSASGTDLIRVPKIPVWTAHNTEYGFAAAVQNAANAPSEAMKSTGQGKFEGNAVGDEFTEPE